MKTLTVHHGDATHPDSGRGARPAPDEVQVWLYPVPAGPGLSDCGLSAEEAARAARFRLPGARAQFITARSMLRRLLGAALGVPGASLILRAGRHGKPFLEGRPDWHFNVSHSHELVAIALSPGGPAGVDIEFMAPLGDWEPLASRVFAGPDCRFLSTLSGPLRTAAFYRGWTRKEAWLKATGEGLIDDLPGIQVPLEAAGPPRLTGLPPGRGNPGDWTLRDLPLPPQYAGAVAFETGRFGRIGGKRLQNASVFSLPPHGFCDNKPHDLTDHFLDVS